MRDGEAPCDCRLSRESRRIARSGRLGRILACLASCGSLLGYGYTPPAGGQSAEEYELKAAVVFNLAKFVEWPPETFSTPADPVAICVLGESPISIPLEKAIAGKMLDDRKLVIRRISEARQIASCQILFSGAGRARSRPLPPDVKGVLTVGEEDRFTRDGGVVNMKMEGGRIQLQVNLKAADLARVRISSKLLKLVQIVTP
jgi:uncharacterized protein DUF4154